MAANEVISLAAMETLKNLPVETFATAREWADWLAGRRNAPGVWIKLAKKGATLKTLTYEEAREEAIRAGWIDGQINRYDAECYLTRFSPRKAKSVWSKINRTLAEELIEQGRMLPAGLAQYRAAQADGRLDAAYEGQATITVPEDFQRALAACPVAEAFFNGLNKANRYSYLWRIQTAAKPETRSARIVKFIKMLESGEMFHPPAPKGV